jgi:hypothetical protein
VKDQVDAREGGEHALGKAVEELGAVGVRENTDTGGQLRT